MALSIQTNMASVSIQNQLNRTNNDLSTSLERLGSGYRINSARDDAAGLQIASRLTAQSTGQNAALYNISNANSMLETGEGAMDEMTNIAYRLKELATQAANGTNGTKEYEAMDAEYQALAAELTNIMANTSYGGTNLLNPAGTGTPPSPAAGTFADAAGVTFQIGASTSETLKVDVSTQIGKLNTALVTGGTTDVAATTTIDEGTWTALGGLATQGSATAAITEVDKFIDSVSAVRSGFGASMNRLDHTANNLSNMSESTTASISNLMDADYAAESSEMSKQQLLMNSGISVLGTSDSVTQMVGQLLR